MSDARDEDDLRLLSDRARQSKRKMGVLGIIMLSAGGFLASTGVLVAMGAGERVFLVVFGSLFVAGGAFLVSVARKSSARLVALSPRIVRGEGVVWAYVDARDLGNGSELLHLIADDGLEHLMVLPGPEAAEVLTLVKRRVPKARFGEDATLRARYEADRRGIAALVAKEQSSPQAG